jgi:hypothetical protein
MTCHASEGYKQSDRIVVVEEGEVNTLKPHIYRPGGWVVEWILALSAFPLMHLMSQRSQRLLSNY